MSIAQPVARSIAQAVARSVSGAASGRAGYNPANQTGVLQVLDGFSYSASTVDGLPVLQSSVGTLAVPRGQRCVLFDGVNDFASFATVALNDFTVTSWCKLSADGMLLGVDNSSAYVYLQMSGLIALQIPGFGTYNFSLSSAFPSGVWFHLAISRISGVVAVFLNGVNIGGGSGSGSLSLNLLCKRQVGTHLAGLFTDFRIYSDAKSADEIQAIYNQHVTPSTIDRIGLLAAWWLNEESGTTHYDWSGNGRNLTATNITQSTYHATDAGVKFNAANELGYTLSGSVVIPRNEADTTKDALGGSLQYAGPIALPAIMEVPCLTVSGTEYLDLPHLTGSETVVAKVGTSTVSVAAGRINLTAGTVSSILLSDGTRLPLQEGAGSSSTNRTCYNVDGTGRHATLTNGTVATMWAGRLSTVRDWCIENGGSIAANGAFIPGRIGSSLDAAGNTKTLAAGQHLNPFSRFDPNNWSAPSLVNIGSTASDAYAPSDMAGVQAESVADTRFASQKRYAAFRVDQTGSDKANAEGWAAG